MGDNHLRGRDALALQVRGLLEVRDAVPLDAAVAALTLDGLGLSQYREFARFRWQIITSSTEPRERDLIKMTAIAWAGEASPPVPPP